MKVMPGKSLEACRVTYGPYGTDRRFKMTGAWFVPLATGVTVKIISSEGEGWEHVSVSLEDRCPTWPEMCEVKDLFWEETERVLQYHPPRCEYVNLHPFCLHLWKPTRDLLPYPPEWMVGPRNFGGSR